ncbi:Uncharacterized protein OS=Bradyrhizobium sp. STM 3809 GN=BRAS3809_6300003 PE=4 SV=1: zf-HC2 [Gemmata massiliana]|uniref:Putative zinc-finger domain-containing protein n=1 Tax=Gemmata massiliana TaxID=1210884 RepID=A0A6P2D653_9BACT|nr:anti-sigma factor [Gemmata massiliana]VTR96473.1 Uncharacterized protein OS=Bradyrhizobium sp. STM 3809 GN=BRAS3809_6300003 PE=4 SV=1: zf-HC2 [Gemmata massiliana]
MDCRDVQRLLHSYADGELDLVHLLRIEEHLAECPECADREQSVRALRETLAGAALYHRAPDSLRARLGFTPVPESVPAPLVRRQRRTPALLVATVAGIVLVVVATLTAVVVWKRPDNSAEDRFAELVVAGHVRSLQVDHVTDVISSDQHTVKPWFRGKLDFSPQVPDFSTSGFVLSGGRLDYLTDRPVAAIVYHRRQHVINVWTWPGANGDERPVRPLKQHGFNLRTWERAGMVYWVISDLNAQELDEFVQLLRESTAPAMP